MKLLIISFLLGLSLAYNYNENKPSELNCDCGWKNEVKYDGKGAELIEYPWLAIIFKYYTFWCGATIITEWHVVTSSRCIGRGHADLLSICTGVLGRKDCVKEHKVKAYYNYQKDKTEHGATNDIAIVTTATKFDFNSYVGPACVSNYITNGDIINDYVLILVWSATYNLKEMEMQVVHRDNCKSAFEEVGYIDKSSHVCTKSLGHYTCADDRGGPVVYLDSVTNRYILLGMVSYSKSVCLTPNDKPTLSTNVSAFLQWMKKKIKDQPGTKLCKKT